MGRQTVGLVLLSGKQTAFRFQATCLSANLASRLKRKYSLGPSASPVTDASKIALSAPTARPIHALGSELQTVVKTSALSLAPNTNRRAIAVRHSLTRRCSVRS
jgi:hypothetical protein